MLEAEFHVRDDFAEASYEAWRALAEADLAGATFEQKLVTHTYEGIDLQPVYTRRDHPGETDAAGFPGLAPFVRGSQTCGAARHGWDLRQEQTHPDLVLTNRAILEDLEGGVTSVLLRLDAAARNGLDPDDPAASALVGRDGIMAYHGDDLATVLAGVHLTMVSVTLEAGAAFLPAAAMLVALWRRSAVPADQARGAFNADPLAVLARDGHLPMTAESALMQMADLAAWTDKHYPQVTAVRVGTAPYHHAGATAVQDIAFSMGSAVEYLRAMAAAGMPVDAAARQILFSISLGTHHFLAIAKLRAARRLWSRVVEACGGTAAAGAMRIHARVSKRVLTLRDPYVNILRNTAACFAAALGGVDSITSTPFDVTAGPSDAASRRIARNTVHILQEEGHLHRVIDPPGGSWYLDWLTDEVAAKAWEVFQEVERRGGMLSALRDGWVARQIDSAFTPRARNLARRKEGITGVSEFPDVHETPIFRPAPDRDALRTAAAQRAERRRTAADAGRTPLPAPWMEHAVVAAMQGASLGQLARSLRFHAESVNLPPLAPHPFAEPFEELRTAADDWLAQHGERPRVFLANLGSAAHFTARSTYAKNFFEAGGFGVISPNGFQDPDAAAAAFVASGAGVAVLCSSDKLYADLAAPVATKLKAAGARCVVLAGNPGANEAIWRNAGVDRFIFIKCDVLETLRDLLRSEGVLPS